MLPERAPSIARRHIARRRSGSVGRALDASGDAARSKLAYLDSLRGLASIAVVFAHFVGAFYPWAIFGEPYVRRSNWERWLQTPPLSLATAGHFAVCLFFILSGYVLSVRFLSGRTRPGELVHAVLKRPVRLGGMVLFTVAIGYALMGTGWLGPLSASENATLPWLDRFWQTTPSALAFAKDLLLEPFASSSSYNPPLWTIHKELVGSYLVFGYIALSLRRTARWRMTTLAVLGAFTFSTLYVGFVIGLAFAEATGHQPRRCEGAPLCPGAPKRRTARVIPQLVSYGLLVLGLWFGCQLHYQGIFSNAAEATAARAAVSLEEPLGVMMSLFGHFGTGGAGMLGAALTFAAVWMSPRFQAALDQRVLRYLGRISFAVYALHFLLLGSLGAGLHRTLLDSLGWHAAAIVSTLVSFGCLIPLSELVTRWIDRPSITASAIFATKAVAAARMSASYMSASRKSATAEGTQERSAA